MDNPTEKSQYLMYYEIHKNDYWCDADKAQNLYIAEHYISEDKKNEQH